MTVTLAEGLVLSASLLLFIAGACLFLKSRQNKIKSGIDVGEFISSQYMIAPVPFGAGKTKNLLLRRISMEDFAAMGDIPNWITIFMKGDVKDISETKKNIEEKSDEELLSDTKKYYELCQRIAERSIVRWKEYVEKWKSIDPEYTGTLPKEALDFIFSAQTAPLSKYIKKKMAYSVLLALQKEGAARQIISEKPTTEAS